MAKKKGEGFQIDFSSYAVLSSGRFTHYNLPTAQVFRTFFDFCLSYHSMGTCRTLAKMGWWKEDQWQSICFCLVLSFYYKGRVGRIQDIHGGGGRNRLCARTHITSAKPEVLRPGSMGSLVLSEPYFKHSDSKWNIKKQNIVDQNLGVGAPSIYAPLWLWMRHWRGL